MAERLADIVAQIQNVQQLSAVVTAMRGIAASRARQSRSLLDGINEYSDVISRAIGEALGLLPSDVAVFEQPAHARAGLILFCAEQGFAGAFSERVLDAAAGMLDGATTFVIGTRGAVIAKERGLEPALTAPMATQVDAILGVANRLADTLYRHVAAGTVAKADILFSRSLSGSGIAVERQSLLPVAFKGFAPSLRKQAPLTTLAPAALLERLAAEYVFAQLCRAAIHAFEAENEARMLAMASAKTNIESKLSGLSRHERQLRQEEITTEIVELAAGAEALAGRFKGKPA